MLQIMRQAADVGLQNMTCVSTTLQRAVSFSCAGVKGEMKGENEPLEDRLLLHSFQLVFRDVGEQNILLNCHPHSAVSVSAWVAMGLTHQGHGNDRPCDNRACHSWCRTMCYNILLAHKHEMSQTVTLAVPLRQAVGVAGSVPNKKLKARQISRIQMEKCQ